MGHPCCCQSGLRIHDFVVGALDLVFFSSSSFSLSSLISVSSFPTFPDQTVPEKR